MEPLKITGKQLFIDEEVIASRERVMAVMNPAVKYYGNPLIVADRPWEHSMIYVYKGTVLWEPDEAIYKMWYQIYTPDAGEPYTVAYATSADGLTWEKPALGIIDYQGRKDNNLVFTGNKYAANVNVFKDTRDPDPTRLYKNLYWDSGATGGADGICVAFSPDGLLWTPAAENPVLMGTGDTHHVLGWDDRYNKYIGYFRPRGPEVPRAGKLTTRTIGRSESDDFVHWTPPRMVLAPDEADPPDTQFYHIAVFKYEGLYLGFLGVFHTNSLHIDHQLVASRDGINWRRLGGRQPFLGLGDPGNFDAGMAYIATPVIAGNEIRIYYGGFNTRHSYRDLRGIATDFMPPGAKPAAGIGMARLPLDGFVSVDAGPNPGTLTTRPLTFTGRQLYLNAQFSAKQSAGMDDESLISVELLDGSGQPISGYTLSEAIPISGDGLEFGKQVTWQDKPGVAALQHLPVQLRFHLRNVKLYAFWFGDDEG